MYEISITEISQVYIMDDGDYFKYFVNEVYESDFVYYTMNDFEVVNSNWVWGGARDSWTLTMDDVTIPLVSDDGKMGYFGDSVVSQNIPPKASLICNAIYFDDSVMFGNAIFSIDSNLYGDVIGVVCVNEGGTKKWKYVDTIKTLVGDQWKDNNGIELKLSGLWQNII